MFIPPPKPIEFTTSLSSRSADVFAPAPPPDSSAEFGVEEDALPPILLGPLAVKSLLGNGFTLANEITNAAPSGVPSQTIFRTANNTRVNVLPTEFAVILDA